MLIKTTPITPAAAYSVFASGSLPVDYMTAYGEQYSRNESACAVEGKIHGGVQSKVVYKQQRSGYGKENILAFPVCIEVRYSGVYQRRTDYQQNVDIQEPQVEASDRLVERKKTIKFGEDVICAEQWFAAARWSRPIEKTLKITIGIIIPVRRCLSFDL